MKIVLPIIVILFLMSCNNSVNQKRNREIKFYDFSVIINAKNSFKINDFKYIIGDSRGDYENWDTSRVRIEEKVLYYITYHYVTSDNYVERLPIDTIKCSLTDTQLDSIFILTKNLFDLSFLTNTTIDSIPPPPLMNDGIWSKVTFDLGFRGDLYELFISVADTEFCNNDSYVNLIKYLGDIKSKK